MSKKYLGLGIIAIIAVFGFLWTNEKNIAQAQATAPFIVDHTNLYLFDQIPDQYITAASNLRMMWGDRSVGGNINEALGCLAYESDELASNVCKVLNHLDPQYSATAADLSWYRAGGYPRTNWTFYFDPGQSVTPALSCTSSNGLWDGLVGCFIEHARNNIDQFDVFSYQHSYLTILPGSSIANTNNGYFVDQASRTDVFDYQRLETDFPNKKFFYWTTSLARGVGSQEGANYNSQMRQFARNRNKVLFDVADIESHDLQGNPCYDNRDGVTYRTENLADDGLNTEAICQHYTTETEGGHLGSISIGKIRLAKGYWIVMAYLAGWRPGTVTPPPPPSDTTPPSVSITAPTNGATISGTVSITANASDNIGVSGVQFRIDGTNVGSEDSSSPYSYSWNTTTATNASHTITTVARDAAGNTTTSSSVSVTVNNAVAPTTFTLTVSKAGSGSGTVTATGINCGTDCSETVNSGTAVSLTATPTTGSTFAGWSGGGCSGTGSCSVTVSANTTVSATFNTAASPLTISNITSSGITTSGANISWATNNPSDSQIEYGLTNTYGQSSTLDTSLVTAHSMAIANLSANTTYHYRVRSRDAGGSLVTSTDQTFSTTAAPPTVSGGEDWPMAGYNPQRTSSSAANVSTVAGVSWYRPIEAYISGSTQLVTSGDKVYVATAKGLVVLNAENGNLVCRFDTEMPINTPTVDSGVVYVSGYDHKLYALNASNCNTQWTFTGASSGYSANPLVTGGRVYVGNRDGRFYAVNASNGSLAWTYTTGGPIMQSAAYDNNVIYVASMDMYGYAINTSGSLIWRTSQKLPGEQYSNWWPVIHGNYVVWAGSTAYKAGLSPGANDAGTSGVSFNAFFGSPTGTVSAGSVISSSDGSQGWPVGSTIMSATLSGGAANTLQGWADSYPARRVYAVVNKSNGVEPFYLPMIESGQNEQGQMHPPVSDGTALYFNGPYQRSSTNIPRSRVMAWKDGSSWLRLLGGGVTFAADEPLILSRSGARLFANLCCDREARTIDPGSPNFWTYGSGSRLSFVIPSGSQSNPYDSMWAFYDGETFLERLGGYYNGNTNSRNGVYNSHGMQNPLVPLAFINGSSQRVERLFTHRSNAIIALGPTASETPLPLVTVNNSPSNSGTVLSNTEVQSRLENEVQKMVSLFISNGNNGFLKPAYINDAGAISNTTDMPENNVYFKTPADTLYTLSAAYPYLSSGLRSNLLSYLNAYWQKYFVTNLVRVIGWNSGTQRENMIMPPEVATRMSQIGDTTAGTMPQRVFYAGWKYAQLVPTQAASIYSTLRPLLVYPPPVTLDIVRGPGIYNDYVDGYQGFLNLYDLAGTNPDPTLRANVATQLSNLLNTRLTNFAKDHPWEGSVDNPTGIVTNNYTRKFNCARNFLYMTPSLGSAMRNSAQYSTINSAINEYLYVCPFWFMTRDSNTFQEGAVHHIFDSHALFLAKAYVSGESQANLSKWIDVPWMLGDLYHIQNLVATLEAGGVLPPPPPPTGPFTLTVSKTGTGSGTVTGTGINCGTDCSESINSGTAVTLTATSAAGSSFAGWSGGGCSGTGSCTITMAANTAVTATFNTGVVPPPSTKFTIGQRVQANANVNVRATASAAGTLLGTQSLNALGTVAAGPTNADGFNWWSINYDTGADGWSAEDYLSAYTTPVPPPPSGPLQISSVTGISSLPRYEKQEISFNISGGAATNFNLPYDASAPAGVPGTSGITVNAQFSQNNFATTITVPAFYYQNFDYQTRSGRDWIAPTDQFSWRVRFAPNNTGSWQYRITATDASGSVTSATQTFNVTTSSNKGFLKVSSTDSRYFEFEDGTPFIGSGYNGGIDWFSLSPISSATSRLQTAGQNGVELIRTWLTQASIFGSAWNPWYGLRGDYGGYIPRTGLTPTNGKMRLRMTYAESGGSRNTGYFEACRFVGGFTSGIAIKRNTNYKFRVNYQGLNMSGPRNTAFANYGLVLKMQNPASGTWHTNCYDAGTSNSTGLVISPYGGNTSGFVNLEGTWNSGNNDFLPPFYLALENISSTASAGAAYIDSVEIREELTDGTLTGPNLINKPSMEQQLYFDQKNSFVFDKILEQAKQNGVYLKTVVLEKDEDILGTLDASGNFGAFNANNFYGNYRSMTATRWLEQAWWRYLQARWGYSTNIHSWELVNEGDPLNDRHYTLADEFGKYIRTFAPNNHLVTTSFWHSLPASNFWRNASYPNVDYADLHAYVSTSQTGEFNISAAKDAVVRTRCGTDNTCFKNSMKNDAALYRSEHSLQAADRTLGKPLVRGEAGLDSPSQQVEDTNLTRDTSGTWLHNFIWSGLDVGGMYDLYWWTTNLFSRSGPDGSATNGLQELYAPFKDFLSNIPIDNGLYRDVAATVSDSNNVRVLGQKDVGNGRAHLWIQNRKHIWCAVVGGVTGCPYTWDNSRLSGTITISGFAANSSYTVDWWQFSANGALTRPAASSIVANSLGNIVINLDSLPATVVDLAVKLSGASGGTVPPPPPPSSTRFTIGQRVQATTNLNVRSTPSINGILLGTQSINQIGTVVSGPIAADDFNWWNINYDNGVDGYSVETYLSAYTAPPTDPGGGGGTTGGGTTGGTTGGNTGGTTGSTSGTTGSTSGTSGSTSGSSSGNNTTTSSPVSPTTQPIGAPNLTRTVYVGSQGSDIVELQNFLIRSGYLTADSNTGYFGNLTRSAVQRFQCERIQICSGDESTTGWGMVGARTRAAMGSVNVVSTPVSTPTVSGTSPNLTRTIYVGSRGADVVELQNFFIKLGYLAADNNTGYFGNLTRAAVQKYQCEKMQICSGDESTTGWGMVGARTRAELKK